MPRWNMPEIEEDQDVREVKEGIEQMILRGEDDSELGRKKESLK